MIRFDPLHLPIIKRKGKPHVNWLGKLVPTVTNGKGWTPLIRAQRYGGNHLIELAGKRFGRLLVLERDGRNVSRISRWLCQCDCGELTTARSDNLRRGQTTSCGCWRLEQGRANCAKWNRARLESAA